jgi:ADP-heptose:LPS heptosyltransferase
VSVKRLLIYRLGGLGDTIVALPALHLIARAFPSARRFLLTNLPTRDKQVNAEAVLGSSLLIHGYITYPHGLRNWYELLALRNAIREFKPQLLIYLTEARGMAKTLRDVAFFLSCGITRIIGLPLSTARQSNQFLSAGLFESEAARLLRCIRKLGSAELTSTESWVLPINDAERQRALCVLTDAGLKPPFLALSIGTKIHLKDWGDSNWIGLIRALNNRYPELPLVFLGAKEEFDRSGRLAAGVCGRTTNLCGQLTVRESAVILERALAFVGHDSGPMHLAAAVGTPTVAIFSARSKPGIWFPNGANHEVIRPPIECFGCTYETCGRKLANCTTLIRVDTVTACIHKVLAGYLSSLPHLPKTLNAAQQPLVHNRQ